MATARDRLEALTKDEEAVKIDQDKFSLLEQDLSEAERRLDEDVDYAAPFEKFEESLKEIEQVKDEQERSTRLDILKADLKAVRDRAQQEEKDLARLVFALNTKCEQLGLDYKGLQSLNEAEEKLIADADARLKDAEFALAKAEQRRFNFFGWKDKAIAQAKAELENATAGIHTAEMEARTRYRERLMKNSMDESIQDFMQRVNTIKRKLEQRLGEVKTQLAQIVTQKGQTFDNKATASKAIEELDERISQMEQELQLEEDKLQSLIHGSPEYTEQETNISNQRAKVEDLRGRRNTALALFQSYEMFATQFEIQENTLTKLQHNLNIWISRLEADTEARAYALEASLEALKTAADQEVAKEMHEAGQELDLSMAQTVAEIGRATDHARQQMLEAHPELFERMTEILHAAAEATQEIRLREHKLIEEWKQRYGIDPTESSIFHYAEETLGVGDKPN